MANVLEKTWSVSGWVLFMKNDDIDYQLFKIYLLNCSMMFPLK